MTTTPPGTPIYLSLQEPLIYLHGDPSGVIVQAVRQIPGGSYSPPDHLWTFPVESARQVALLAWDWHIPVPDEIDCLPGVHPHPNVWLEGNHVHVWYEYNPVMNKQLHLIPAITLVNDENRKELSNHYRTPLQNWRRVIQWAEVFGLFYQPGFVADMELLEKDWTDRHEASSALDADLVIDSAIPLLPYQRAGVKYLLETRRVMLCDEQGLGKSVQALAATRAHGSKLTVVVCPNTLKLNWELEANKFFPGTTVTIVSGTQPAPIEPADLVVVNYDIIAKRADDVIALEPDALVVDESHKIKNGKESFVCPECGAGGYNADTIHCGECSATFEHAKSVWSVKRTGGVMDVARAIPLDGMVVLLTGTPIVNRPIELVPQLECIGRMGIFENKTRFRTRYAPGGTGARNLKELNQKLRSNCFMRRTLADVKPELPKLRNAMQLVQVDPELFRVYQDIEADVIEYLARRAMELADSEGRDPEAAYWEKRLRAEAAEHLVRISVLKNAVIEMKMPAIKKWVDEFLDDGDKKIVVFGSHISAVEDIYSEFENMAVKIRGGVSTGDRMKAVSEFQTNPDIRVFAGNMDAASEGITLTASRDVAFMELGWTPALHAQCASRCHGRANDPQPATAWYLLAAHTIDVEIFHLLETKSRVINAATDGVEIEEQGSVLGDLLVSLARRGLSGEAN